MVRASRDRQEPARGSGSCGSVAGRTWSAVIVISPTAPGSSLLESTPSTWTHESAGGVVSSGAMTSSTTGRASATEWTMGYRSSANSRRWRGRHAGPRPPRARAARPRPSHPLEIESRVATGMSVSTDANRAMVAVNSAPRTTNNTTSTNSAVAWPNTYRCTAADAKTPTSRKEGQRLPHDADEDNGGPFDRAGDPRVDPS